MKRNTDTEMVALEMHGANGYYEMHDPATFDTTIHEDAVNDDWFVIVVSKQTAAMVAPNVCRYCYPDAHEHSTINHI